jgi:hypothetical protein
MKFLYLFFAVFLGGGMKISAQTKRDSLQVLKEKTKKGCNFGALPAFSFDSDLGFQYGLIANMYNYGDGSIYPRYKHSFYTEWSRTTKGSGKNQFLYDSEYLIPGIRLNAEASLLTDQALFFYGFNGYNASYNKDYENEGSSSYISKMYYRLERKLTRLKTDFQGKIKGREFRWLAGFAFFNNKIGHVDFNNLNKGINQGYKLRDTTLLYDKYVEWGFIPAAQKDGGITNLIDLGLIYDTRDNEPNPMRGIWTEVLLLAAPSFFANKFNYTRIAITHRQYFTIRKETINLVYRISYQGKISGTTPFYMMPYVFNSNITREGLGGAKTLRGILRNRVVGEDIVYGNLEVRWKFLRFTKFNQNFYFATTGFTDFGRVTGKYHINTTNSEALTYLKNGASETWHTSFGAGLYAAMNQNFVAALNYGRATDLRDGKNGIYIGLDFLF